MVCDYQSPSDAPPRSAGTGDVQLLFAPDKRLTLIEMRRDARAMNFLALDLIDASDLVLPGSAAVGGELEGKVTDSPIAVS